MARNSTKETQKVESSSQLIPKLLRVGEVAEIIQVTPKAVHRMVLAGKLPRPICFGKRCVRWSEEEVLEFILGKLSKK